MGYKVIFRKNAERQVLEINEWYESQKLGLGAEFLLAVEASLFAIQRNPFIFQLRFKNIRCAIIQRFPYGIYYLIDGEKIMILSIFHFKQRHKYGRNI